MASDGANRAGAPCHFLTNGGIFRAEVKTEPIGVSWEVPGATSGAEKEFEGPSPLTSSFG